MGIFSSIKKLFFATESVAKSSIEKSTEYVKEQASDFVERAKEVVQEKSEDFADSTSGLREAISKKAEEGFSSVKDMAADLGAKVKDVASTIDEKFDATVEAQLIASRCSEPPQARSSWSLHLLADKMSDRRCGRIAICRVTKP
jgi:DNA anti-recombination protein RmuC